MARKRKFEEEKKCLDSVRRRLDEAIEEAENMQHAHGGKDEYELALMYQGFVGVLREIRVACGEDKKENG